MRILCINVCTSHRKWAPKLRVGVYHGSAKGKIYESLDKLDVVLSTLQTGLFGENNALRFIKFHRLIIDECHQREAFQGTSASGGASKEDYDSTYAWGCTGTPLSSSVYDLSKMAKHLGQWDGGLKLSQWAVTNTSQERRGFDLASLAPVLRRAMIRRAPRAA